MCRGGERGEGEQGQGELLEEAPAQAVDVKGGKYQDKTFYFFH